MNFRLLYQGCAFVCVMCVNLESFEIVLSQVSIFDQITVFSVVYIILESKNCDKMQKHIE